MRYIGHVTDYFRETLTATQLEFEISSNFEFFEGKGLPVVTGHVAIYKYPYQSDELVDRMTPVADITLTELDAQGTVEVLVEVSLPVNLVNLAPPDLLRAANSIIDQEAAINIHQRYSRTSILDQVNVAIDSIYVLEWSWQMHVPDLDSLGRADPLAATQELADFHANIDGITEETRQVFALTADPAR